MRPNAPALAVLLAVALLGIALAFDFEVLLLIDGEDVTIGEPLVEGASLRARIAAHGRGRKLRFMKYKSKVRYRRTLGHRQPITRRVVESITKG